MKIDIEERRKQAFEEIAKNFDSLTQMANYFGVTAAAIHKWKLYGIPESRVPYFMLKYPKLEAWKGLPRGV